MVKSDAVQNTKTETVAVNLWSNTNFLTETDSVNTVKNSSPQSSPVKLYTIMRCDMKFETSVFLKFLIEKFVLRALQMQRRSSEMCILWSEYKQIGQSRLMACNFSWNNYLSLLNWLMKASNIWILFFLFLVASKMLKLLLFWATVEKNKQFVITVKTY